MTKPTKTVSDFPEINLERLMREVNILLISDLHYDINKKATSKGSPSGLSINRKLVKSLKKKGSEWEPDILIIAGDLVNHGKKANYAFFFDLIERITKKFPNLKNAIFSTPGNHDINRENIVAIFKYLYSLRKDDPAFKNGTSFTKSDIIDTLFAVTRYNLDFLGKGKLDKYLGDFEKEYFKTYLEKDKELQEKYINKITKHFPIKGLRTVYLKDILGIKLISMNSSFFCNLNSSSNDRNNLFYVKDVVDQTLKALGDSHLPVVTFMHHPFYYMHESEYIYPFTDGPLQEHNNFNKIADVSDLILSGHVHGELHEPSVIHQKAYSITNGTSFTGDDWSNKSYPLTYAMIKINKQLNKFMLHRFKYDGIDFNLIENENDRYYPFQTNTILSNSLELEKVHLIKYFIQLALGAKRKQSVEFELNIIKAQLRIYNNLLDIKNLIFESKLFKLKNDILKYIKFSKTIKGILNNIFVIKIESNSYSAIVKELMESFKPILVSTNSTIYFALKISEIFPDSDEIILTQDVKVFTRQLKSFVLSTKCSYSRLDLIYY